LDCADTFSPATIESWGSVFFGVMGSSGSGIFLKFSLQGCRGFPADPDENTGQGKPVLVHTL
jgi:hypothetical protein